MALQIRLWFDLPPAVQPEEVEAHFRRPDSGLAAEGDAQSAPLRQLWSEVDTAMQIAAVVLSAPAAAQSIVELIKKLRERTKKAPSQALPPPVVLIVNNVQYQIGEADRATLERLLG